jgi:hypothetical protein
MRAIKLIDDARRVYACGEVMRAPVGWLVRISEPKRSDDQNRRFHAMIDDLVRQEPEGRVLSKDMWKAIVIHSWRKDTVFERDLDGDIFPGPKRSSELSVREMGECMEIMNVYAAKHGVVWSEPMPEYTR